MDEVWWKQKLPLPQGAYKITFGQDAADGCKQMGNRRRQRGTVGLVFVPEQNSGPLILEAPEDQRQF